MCIKECKCGRTNCSPYIKESGNVNDKLEYGYTGQSEVSILFLFMLFYFSDNLEYLNF